jgi:protein gp37
VNTTNIWHLRHEFADRIRREHGKDAGDAAVGAIRKAITCYAAVLHLNKGLNIAKPERGTNRGYAPIFEAVTQFPGRVGDAAEWPDLLGRQHPEKPWKEALPRMIFVSDMGDALSTKADFPYLKSDLMPAIRSDSGKRHLWLWLTKRPERMAEFAQLIGGFPPNVCAMTTVTGPDAEKLGRIDHLRRVKASVRGLSIEPLWERIPPRKLNLKGIDWVIVGGESGAGDLTRPFAIEWAEELREHCRKNDVAFFLKQLGRNPSRDGEVFRLHDRHGGDWSEWDESLRIREFPAYFHDYRADEKTSQPVMGRRDGSAAARNEKPATREEISEFKRLDRCVRLGAKAFLDCGTALKEIHDRELWRAGGYSGWEVYCRSVVGVSKPHAHRLIQASRIAMEISQSLPIGNDSAVMPISESQVRPLQRLQDPEKRKLAWTTAVEKAEGQPTANQVQDAVFDILEPTAPAKTLLSRGQQRVVVVGRLKDAIARRGSWEELEAMLNELEDLI